MGHERRDVIRRELDATATVSPVDEVVIRRYPRLTADAAGEGMHDKIVERWGRLDDLGLLRQLGLAPA